MLHARDHYFLALADTSVCVSSYHPPVTTGPTRSLPSRAQRAAGGGIMHVIYFSPSFRLFRSSEGPPRTETETADCASPSA